MRNLVRVQRIDPAGHPLQFDDRSGNERHLFSGSLCLFSRLSHKRVRSEFRRAGSEKICLALANATNATLCPTELLGQFFCHSTFHLL